MKGTINGKSLMFLKWHKKLLQMSEVYKLMYRFQNFFLKKCPVAGIYLDEKDFNIILREQKV